MIIINLNKYLSKKYNKNIIKNKKLYSKIKLSFIKNFYSNINNDFVNVILNNRKCKCIIFIKNNIVISTIIYKKISNYIKKNKYIIHLFCVKEKFRNKGYGRQSFLLFSNFISKNTNKKIEIVVNSVKNALNFYEKIGFKCISINNNLFLKYIYN